MCTVKAHNFSEEKQRVLFVIGKDISIYSAWRKNDASLQNKNGVVLLFTSAEFHILYHRKINNENGSKNNIGRSSERGVIR